MHRRPKSNYRVVLSEAKTTQTASVATMLAWA